SGRISRCSLTAGPIFNAAVWLNRYSKYWQAQFDLLAATIGGNDPRGRTKTPSKRTSSPGKGRPTSGTKPDHENVDGGERWKATGSFRASNGSRRAWRFSPRRRSSRGRVTG